MLLCKEGLSIIWCLLFNAITFLLEFLNEKFWLYA